MGGFNSGGGFINRGWAILSAAGLAAMGMVLPAQSLSVDEHPGSQRQKPARRGNPTGKSPKFRSRWKAQRRKPKANRRIISKRVRRKHRRARKAA